MVTAGDLYELRLQRGRILQGMPLAVACAFRNLAVLTTHVGDGATRPSGSVT